MIAIKYLTLEEQLERDALFIYKFLKINDLKLVKVGKEYNGKFYEALYFFNDNLGGYNIETIKDSLDDD